MAPEGLHGRLKFDIVSLVEHSSPPMMALSLVLIAASVVVWFTAIVKFSQLRRWQHAEHALQAEMRTPRGTANLREMLARHTASIGSRLLAPFSEQATFAEFIDSDTDYLATLQEQRVFAGLTLLASIATAAPLMGLFGTVYGIMEAFAMIGVEKSASLQIVAPAIGDALVTTILGLLAAIPAVVAYNLLSRQGEQLLDESRAFARSWLRRAVQRTG